MPNDPLDNEIARIVNSNRNINIPIVKADRGYIIGTDLIAPFLKGNNYLVRVGGGYDKLED